MIVCFGLTTNSFSQSDPILEGSDIRPLTTSGSIGVTANAYTANGIQNRRAPASLQTNANLNFSLFGISSGLNLLYSTEQSRLRQNMNNLSFDASWKWLAVQAGDVSPSFSDYGLNGTSIRGGYVELTPGNWELELTAGRSKRRVEFQPQEGFREPSFERWTMAGRFGYSSQNDNHFFLSSHFSSDNTSTLQNSGSITPQENLTLTPDAQISLFNGKFVLNSQVTVSAYTRDLNSPVLPTEEAGLPSFLTNIMQPHTSSRLNYAGKASADFNLDLFGLQLGYERVQPGYISLGTGRIRDDQENILISPAFQLFDNKLALQGNLTLGRDNLLGTRLQTRKNTGIGANAQIQLTDMIIVNGNYNLQVNDFSSNTSIDTLQQVSLAQEQVSHSFMLQPSITIQQEQTTHSISLSGSYFTFGNEFKGEDTQSANNFESDTYSSSVNYSITFPTGFSINTMGNILKNESRQSENFTMGANLGATYSILDRKMTLSLNAGVNQNRSDINSIGQNFEGRTMKSRQLMLNLTTNYRLYDKGSLSLTVRSRSNNVIEGQGSKYSELEGNFKFQHRF